MILYLVSTKGETMKKLILISIILISCSSFAEEGKNENATETLVKIVSKGTKEVHKFSGFFFNVDLVQGKPNLTINFLDVIKKTPQVVNTTPVLIVRSGAPSTEEEIVLDEINEIDDLKNGSVVKFGDENKTDISHSARFDFLDKDGNRRLSEWFDLKSGFGFRSAFYNNKGELIGMNFYSKLRINREASDFHLTGSSISLHLEKTKHHQNVRLYNISDVEKFGNELLGIILKSTGANFDE
jgi:hypothetical protein